MRYKDHKRLSLGRVGCAVLTISDTRTEKSDDSCRLITGELKKDMHEILFYDLIWGDSDQGDSDQGDSDQIWKNIKDY